MDLMFFITVVLLGIGLSMDAFSTSVVNVVSLTIIKIVVNLQLKRNILMRKTMITILN